MTIVWDEPIQTRRDREEVRIYTSQGQNKLYPVIGEVCTDHLGWVPRCWGMEGQSDNGSDYDLVNVPKQPQQHTVWVIVYGRQEIWPHDFEVSVCFKKDDLDSYLTEGRIACFEHTFTEGEGIE